MTPELIGIITVGVALGGLIVPLQQSVSRLRERMAVVETILKALLGPDRQHLLSPIETASLQDEDG